MSAAPATARCTPPAAAPCQEAAFRQLRAAQLRRQLEGERDGIFVHAARPAMVPCEPEYAAQRRFGAGTSFSSATLTATDREAAHLGAEFKVFRDGGCDVAEVTAELGIHPSAQLTIRLHPAELRDLAARLIDAAHDIEAHPAAALARTQPTTQVAA